MAKKPAYTMNWVTDHLAVGSAPMSYDQLDAIAAQGVDAILNLCGEFCDLHDIEAGHGFEVYYLPIPDEEAPDMHAMEKALHWLDESIYLGKRVLIHCRHGIGRTGTVLNAYLLRRGLGPKLAGKKLKGLKSKPASFDQWWSLRKYAKKTGRLKVREPSLEFKNLVDLGPFFADYEALAARVEARVRDMTGEKTARCGLDHTQCCRRPIRLAFVEAVYVNRQINVTLASSVREELISRAMETARREAAARKALQDAGKEDLCLWRVSETGAPCPLLAARTPPLSLAPESSEAETLPEPTLPADQAAAPSSAQQQHGCLIYEKRPLVCRCFELEEAAQEALWSQELEPMLETLSHNIFVAFTGFFPDTPPPRLTLPDVASGRYVQQFFRFLLDHRKDHAQGMG